SSRTTTETRSSSARQTRPSSSITLPTTRSPPCPSAPGHRPTPTSCPANPNSPISRTSTPPNQLSDQRTTAAGVVASPTPAGQQNSLVQPHNKSATCPDKRPCGCGTPGP